MNATTDAALARANCQLEIVNLIFRFQSYFGLIIVVLLAVLISPVRNDANLFLKPNNLLNIILYASETGVLAVGMTLVILVAGIDLSVGSIMALVGYAAGVLLMQDNPVTLPIDGTIVIGHWPAIAIILFMLSIARGLGHVISADNSIPLAYGPNLGDPLFKALGQPFAGIGTLCLP